ncbi:MAG: YfhO family protein [Tannerella sp.]|nr:YfhO family protein [Tannerella sp.]
MATMAPVIGGIILCYRKKYLWGIIVTLIFTGLNVFWGHQQISYYLLLMILALAIVYLIYAIREHTLADYFKSSAILLVVATLAIAPDMGRLLTTADYTKETMRGGAVLQNTTEGKKTSSGLDIDYAFQWSYGRGETMTLLIPNFYGASSHYNIGKDSETYKVLRPTGQADQFCKYAPAYWGDQPFTSGPVYVGAVVCFLFVLGLIIVKGPEKWWLLSATLLSLILSWGRHFPLNEFLFHYLPLYNKFRTPSMALVILEVTMAALGILAVKTFLKQTDRRKLLRPLYIAAGITGGLCLFYALLGSSVMSFSTPSDARYQEYPELLAALTIDRQQMLTSDAWRSFLFIAFAAGALWFYLRQPYKVTYAAVILGALIFIDLWTVDKRFINHDSFVPKKKAQEIVPTAADLQILEDKDPNYRVFNLTGDPFNESQTSYFHKTIGGYSPAKLRRYQDIIEYHLSQNINPNVLNMLNTRYLIVQTQQGPQVRFNDRALGNAWFVDRLQWVNSPDEEIVALKDFNPAETAVIDVVWKEKPVDWETLQHGGKDSSAVIQLTDYVNPGNLLYKSSSTQPRLAVFSEVFYKTWHAYIDGVEAPLIRVNYILRGLAIPAGEHQIEFKCVDEMYYLGAGISLTASIVAGLVIACLLAYALWTALRQLRPKQNAFCRAVDDK